jgi:uncharacterized protein (DUF1697 family)
MNTHVLLLRGINVGGRNKLPMKALVSILEDFGCEDVRTYIQSGNIVLQCTRKTASQLANKLGREVKKRCGFEPHVLLLERAEFTRAIAASPFPEAENDPKSLHLGFLDAAPANPDLDKLAALKATSERFELTDKVFYLYAPEGVGKSKLATSSEKILGVAMTYRNWRTVCKIRELVEDMGRSETPMSPVAKA